MSLKKTQRQAISTTVATIVLIIGAIVLLFPLAWVFSTSLKSSREVFLDSWIPDKLLWSNYLDALKAVPLVLYFKNTMFVLIPVLIGTLVSNSLVAYGFARLNVPKKGLFFTILMATMLLPGQVLMIPQFLIFQQLNLVDSTLPLILPAFFGSAFNIFLLRQYMSSIPFSFDEAAAIDGASKFTIFWRVIMPLCKPVLTAISIFAITGVWNDYQGPLIYLKDINKFTLAIGISMFKGKYAVEWNMMMAATILVMLPIVILFFVAQKYFIEGITISSGVKG